ncbi:uncharacterized protein LOC105765555 [Gossypium raimondii]|uniref:uncharacterized protein LOC105765555 n=1 Tax=Gossypium raimondii TaxID=29730 RepID=UPI00063AAC9A|nr:uncharacterized protein LOC105765555 [Gossypium raimondii]
MDSAHEVDNRAGKAINSWDIAPKVDFLCEKAKIARLCEICATPDYAIDVCPSLCDNTMAHLDAVRNFSGLPQRQYDPYTNTYNQESIPDKNLGQEITQEKLEKDEQVRLKPPLPNIQPLFLEQFNQCRRGKEDKKILETFRNVEINILLLDAIKKISRYAKFLKEICTNKRKLIGNERVNVSENVSVVLQRKMPTKYKDRGMFVISYKIGHLGIKKAMCDLGASINVMPYSIYESLNAGFLTKIGVIIQLADRSVVHLEGVLEDVLVKVNELIFPADFYVIKMEEDSILGSLDLLLGRPFLSTTSTKIDVRSGTLTMEFDGEIVKFNIYDAISHPSEILSIKQSENVKKPVEQRLKRIEARLETFGQQLAELIAIICDR